MSGFNILDSDEYHAQLKFFDVGAIVYYAKIIEWEFPGFSVEKHINNLVKLENEIAHNGFIATIEHRYMMVLKKPM